MDITPLLMTFGLVGEKLCKIVPLSKIRQGAGVVFILFGILFLAGL